MFYKSEKLLCSKGVTSLWVCRLTLSLTLPNISLETAIIEIRFRDGTTRRTRGSDTDFIKWVICMRPGSLLDNSPINFVL